MISIIGAHGTGKSTAISNIIEKINSFEYVQIKEIARFCPFKTGEKSSGDAQNWIFDYQKQIEILARTRGLPIISDRCLIDQYAYYSYWVGKNNEFEELIIDSYSSSDYIYVFPPNPNYLISDGLRPTDVTFQAEIDKTIRSIIKHLNLDNKTNIIYVEEITEKLIDDVISKLYKDSNHIKTNINTQTQIDNDLINKVIINNKIPGNKGKCDY